MNIDEIMYQRMLASSKNSSSSSKNSSSSSKKSSSSSKNSSSSSKNSSSSSKKSSSTSKQEEAARRRAAITNALRSSSPQLGAVNTISKSSGSNSKKSSSPVTRILPIYGTDGQYRRVSQPQYDAIKKKEKEIADRKQRVERNSTVPIYGSEQRMVVTPQIAKAYYKKEAEVKERKKKILQASNTVNLGTNEHPVFVTGRPDLVAEYFRKVGDTAKRREALGLEVQKLPGSFSEYAPADLDDFASGFQQQYEARKAAQVQAPQKTPDVRAAGTGTFNSGGAPAPTPSRAPYKPPKRYSGTAGATRTPVTGGGGAGGPQYGGGGGGQYNPMSSMLRGTAQNTLPNIMARGNTGPAMPRRVQLPKPFPANRRY